MHPLLKGSPHHRGKETNEDVGLGAVLLLMIERAQSKVVLAHAKGVFDLGESDVGLPEGGGVLALEVGAQEVTTDGQFGPLAVLFFLFDGNGQPLAALVVGVTEPWEGQYPRVSKQIRAQFEETLSTHCLPNTCRRRVYTTNMIERVMREIKRRTNVVGIFPNEAAADRLVGAHLLERNDTWNCEQARYLDLDRLEEWCDASG